ncbi:MAG: response regulator transcription factor [Clostridia bacterium]|nr:response regulator transcription factor [Clostridia bacterium]
MAKQTLLIADVICSDINMRKIVSLDNNIEILGDVQDLQSLVDSAKRLKPNAVLVNVDLPGLTILGSVKILKEIMPNVAYVFVSYDPKTRVSYIERNCNLMEIVNLLWKGKEKFPQLSTKILADFRRLIDGRFQTEVVPGQQTKVHLTRRELEVISLLAKGYNDRRIAQVLVISEKTVRNHIRNIRQKLRVESRIQVALYAVQTGLVNLTEISLEQG